MPTTLSESELADIRDQLKKHIADTGETTTSLATRADIPRDFLYRFLNDSYKYSPSFEYISRAVGAIGRRIITVEK